MTQAKLPQEIPKKPKRKRGRPAKNKIEQIDASPKEIAQALVRAAESKAERRKRNMTSEDRLTRIEHMIANSAKQGARNDEQIARNGEQIAKLQSAIAETHTFVVKLERKIDQLSSVIAHLVGKDPLDFSRP